MHAFELQGDFGLDNLRQTQRDLPTLTPGKVLVQVHACSLNYRDLLTVQGSYNPRQRLPLIPLSDGAGEIVEVGPGVDRVAIGDRVMPIFAQQWLSGPANYQQLRNSTLGGPLDGMLSEYVLVDQHGLVQIPAALSYLEAATLPCAALTAWSALCKYQPVVAGDTVLVQGTGGVSLFALQFAKLMGARVIVTSSSDEKLERARLLGADFLINYRENPEWHKPARQFTGGVGVDRVIEVGGAGTFGNSMRAARMGGSIATIGVLSGAAAPMNVLPIVMSSLSIQGIQVGNRDDFVAMNRAIEMHGVKPVISDVVEFAAAPDAFRRMERGAHFGKIVIAFSPTLLGPLSKPDHSSG